MAADLSFLSYKAYQLRRLSIQATSKAGSGHPTSCLSAADIVAALFFYALHYDPCHPDHPSNDRFILSKGHAAPLLYAALAEAGLITEEALLHMRTFDSPLEGHPTPRCPFVEAATGSLGQGLSIGLGSALQARFDKKELTTYVLLGDSEMTEGQVWEAVQIGAHYKLSSVIAIVDCNKLGQTTETLVDDHVDRLQAQLTAFGWRVFVVDGHDMAALVNVLDQARTAPAMVPTAILAKTIKGYGIAQCEGKQGFHGRAFPEKELPRLFEELAHRFPQAAVYQAKTPAQELRKVICHAPVGMGSGNKVVIAPPTFARIDKVATRQAYGQALVAVGKVSDQVIVLDAEVKNSTYAELFEKEFPDRFVQCFIAEQNMVSMGVGLARRGKIPFISTFGAFFTRSFDQVRMAAIGGMPLRLVGSHSGVSIGQDGPSQMGLEDIAMMRTLPGSIVLSPSDAVSAYKLVSLMANYRDGVSYMRTARGATPVVYENDEEFTIGGMKILRQHEYDQACIVATGVTVFEALEANSRLEAENIPCTVIDCYSIKPLDVDCLIQYASLSGNKLVVVEDHYRAGGLGEAVTAALINHDITVESLAVDKLPRSGTPEELRRYESIDAAAIVQAVKKLVL